MDEGSDFKGIVIKFGYLNQYTGLRGSNEKGWFRIDNQRILYPKYGVNWEEGDIVLDIKKEIKENTQMNVRKMIREEIQKLKEEPNLIPIDAFSHYPRVGQKYKGPNGEYEIVSYGPKGPVNYKPRTTPFTIKFADGKTKVIRQKDIPNWFKYQWLVK